MCLGAGASSVLAKMGQLERLLMWQAAVADTWAFAREAAKPEADDLATPGTCSNVMV